MGRTHRLPDSQEMVITTCFLKQHLLGLVSRNKWSTPDPPREKRANIMAITLADMEHKLLTVDQITTVLEKSEPLSTITLDGEQTVRFNFDQDWNHGLKSIADTEPVNVIMTVDGKDHQMTKEAAQQAAAQFGLTSAYLNKIPAKFSTSLMNYHYSTMNSDQAQKMLSVDGVVSAFTRPTLTPFSNVQLLGKVVEGIKGVHGSDAVIMADYKYAHSLQRTDVRLIVPTQERIIHGSGMDDIPSGSADSWLAGVHLSNSLIGKSQTSVEAYMFRWWCTNGATTNLENVGTWNRRSNGQQEDVYEWAREAVDDVLGGMEAMFDQVQALTQLNVTGNIGDVLQEIFKQYSVPVSQREAITAALLAKVPLTMYHVMQAITQAANDDDLDDRRRDRLMRIGGDIPTTTFDTLKARVWREGHAADSTQRNPYEPLVLVG